MSGLRMDMAPVYDEPKDVAASKRRLTLSEEALALASIETAPVQRKTVARELRLVGMIEADETRLARVTAYVGGRLDRLYVQYTGAEVNRGTPLAEMYSPELLTTLTELHQAKQSADRLASSTLESVRKASDTAVQAARERLRLWGLPDAEVRKLESSNSKDTLITIYTPIGGTVVERHVQQGDYVDTGGLIFTVADLSTVWLQMKATKVILAGFSRTGVRFTVDAGPGKCLRAKSLLLILFLTACREQQMCA